MLLLSAPRLYGERVPVKLLRTSNSKVRQKIVDTHNYFRTQVKPPAANMLVMVSDLCIYSNSKYLDPLSFQRVSTYPYNRCAFSKLFERYYSFGFYLRSIRKETNNERILLYKRKFYKSVIRLLYF